MSSALAPANAAAGISRARGNTEAGLLVAEICSDCVYFLAYGQLDDMTMLEMEVAQ